MGRNIKSPLRVLMRESSKHDDWHQDQSKMTAALTHPQWNQETGGLEVAKAFVDNIRGKNGTAFVLQSLSQLSRYTC